MIAQVIRASASEVDRDMFVTICFSLIGLAVSLVVAHFAGFDPSAWMN